VRDTPSTICSGARLTGPLCVVVWIDLPAGNQDNLTSGPFLDWGNSSYWDDLLNPGSSQPAGVEPEAGISTSGQPFGPGDVVQTATGIAGLVLQIIGGVVRIKTAEGQIVEVPATQVENVPPAPAPDYMPWIVGGGALLLVVVLLMGRR